MCTSNSKLHANSNTKSNSVDMTPPVSHINGRPVLQPTCNQVVHLLERRNSLKKTPSKSPIPSLKPLVQPKTTITAPPISPKLKSPRQLAVKRGNEPNNNALNSSAEKVVTPRNSAKLVVKKSRKSGAAGGAVPCADVSSTLKYSSSSIVEAPGSIAAARREHVANMQVQRKMRIAHYGRSKSGKFEGKVDLVDDSVSVREEKRCSFITPNSDPIYVAYHDEEWGVPTHDDKLLFELLALTGAQVGSDWTSVLKKRKEFRDAFSGFDAEIVSKFSEKKINSISSDYGINLSQIRGIVDNSNQILEIKNKFGSFDKYLWGFVNNKSIATQYKSSHKIPVKTSKSEAISKDMVRRGFRLVGPTVIHSFMQAAGLTNDHLTTCSRHLQCIALARQCSPHPIITT